MSSTSSYAFKIPTELSNFKKWDIIRVAVIKNFYYSCLHVRKFSKMKEESATFLKLISQNTWGMGKRRERKAQDSVFFFKIGIALFHLLKKESSISFAKYTCDRTTGSISI